MSASFPRFDAWKAKLDAQREARAKELREALEATRGNVSQAAVRLGVSRQRATVLVRELSLNDFARALRRAAGARGTKATGRPLKGSGE